MAPQLSVRPGHPFFPPFFLYYFGPLQLQVIQSVIEREGEGERTETDDRQGVQVGSGFACDPPVKSPPPKKN